ncbi:MAG: type II secretion system F family protein, partial [Candidatus Eisenbacteria bacterium]|nr:type II secretion system F family protein [Candidatus Eisenbacteria bacterium]
MPVYAWKGKTTAGESQAGELTFNSRDEAVTYLRRKRIIALYIREKPKPITLGLKVAAARVKMKDLVIFTRQFATMINSGLPLVQCLDILSKQAESANFRQIIAGVMHDVEAGSTLSESLGRRPQVFDTLYCNMVDAGEAGGIQDDILQRLAGYLEKAEALRRKVKSAMTYPAVVMTVAIGAT